MIRDTRLPPNRDLEAATYHVEDDEKPSEAVVRAVHAASTAPSDTEANPSTPTCAGELGPPLYYTIDPEALDSVFQAGTSEARVSFPYRDFEIAVHSSGRIDVRPTNTVE